VVEDLYDLASDKIVGVNLLMAQEVVIFPVVSHFTTLQGVSFAVAGYTDVCTRAANPSSKSARGSLSGRRVSRWPRWDTCSPVRR
jgi:hypothetical protein